MNKPQPATRHQRFDGAMLLSIFIVLVSSLIAAAPVQAQTLTTLASFNQPNGVYPAAALIQATDGALYGTAQQGGPGFSLSGTPGGTVFKLLSNGTLATVYNFCTQVACSDGGLPNASLVQGSDGEFYGTTSYGGSGFFGTVFKLSASGTLTTLHSFTGPDGATPYAGLVVGADGDFYGTTTAGGNSGNGTVFKITPSGTLTTLYSFCSLAGCVDGVSPLAGLVLATDGNFYGTTYGGGTDGEGTVFRMTPTGVLTTLHNFCFCAGADGTGPEAAMIQAKDGNLYGTTFEGGPHGGGTVFKMTTGGTLTLLYEFCNPAPNCLDGELVAAGLIQATDGNFYGTTSGGGADSTNGGTVFQLTPAGVLTTLYSFCAGWPVCTDGYDPIAALVQRTSGSFYGVTYGSGTPNEGTLFSLSMGLGPFVALQSTAGRVGSTVRILGTNLTGSTKVTFNGTAATFTVISASEISAKVPTGATTGKVKVVTPARTLTSNVAYRVR